jgi:hypothetical protein
MNAVLRFRPGANRLLESELRGDIAMTAVLIGRLIEQGKLKWETRG